MESEDLVVLTVANAPNLTYQITGCSLSLRKGPGKGGSVSDSSNAKDTNSSMRIAVLPGAGLPAPRVKLKCLAIFEQVPQSAVRADSLDSFPLLQALPFGRDNLRKCRTKMMVAHVADQKTSGLQSQQIFLGQLVGLI